MRAARITALDGPQAIEVADVPDAAGGEDVLVEVHRAGVTFPDVLMTRGRYQRRPDLPFVPGAEVAGVVVGAPEGSGFTPGQRVAAFPILGGLAEWVACTPEHVFALPDDLPLEVAACLPMNYLTALFALDHRGRLAAGETVLVHGAAGGLGTATIQVAAARGARVLAVVSDPDGPKGATARAAGADEVIGADGFKDEVLRHTDGRGVDVVVDPVGGDRFTDSLRSLARDGRVLVLGFTAGAIPEVKVNRLLLRNISVVGAAWGEYAWDNPGYLAWQWPQLMELWHAGAIRPPIGEVFPLERAAEAVAALDDRRAVGRVVVAVRE